MPTLTDDYAPIYRVDMTDTKPVIEFNYNGGIWIPVNRDNLTIAANIAISGGIRGENYCGGCLNPLVGTFTVNFTGAARCSTCAPVS